MDDTRCMRELLKVALRDSDIDARPDFKSHPDAYPWKTLGLGGQSVEVYWTPTLCSEDEEMLHGITSHIYRDGSLVVLVGVRQLDLSARSLGELPGAQRQVLLHELCHACEFMFQLSLTEVDVEIISTLLSHPLLYAEE